MPLETPVTSCRMAGQGADEELRSEVSRLSYRLDEAGEQLGGEAADAGNGAVQTLTVIALVALILTMVLTLASIFEGDRRIGWAQGVAAGLLLAVWVMLIVAVANSEGGGSLDELGFRSTLRTALVPAGAVMSLVALRVARQVRD